MTTLGLSYLEYEESKRSNLAKEAETNRANLAKEAQNRADLAETARANLVNEARNQANLEETIRKNKVEEGLQEKDLLRKAYTDYADGVSKANPWLGIAAFSNMIKRTLGDDVAADLGKSVSDSVTTYFGDLADDTASLTFETIIDGIFGSAAEPIHNWAYEQGLVDKPYDPKVNKSVFEKYLGAQRIPSSEIQLAAEKMGVDKLTDNIINYFISPLMAFAPSLNAGLRSAIRQPLYNTIKNLVATNESWGYTTANGKTIYGFKSEADAEAARAKSGGIAVVPPKH